MDLLPWHKTLWERLHKQHLEGRLPHAMLFAGAKGVGKVQFAEALGTTLLCLNPLAGEACGQCKSCELVKSGSHPDLLRLTPEDVGKVIKVDQVRAVIDRLHGTAQQGGYRILIVHPAEEMNIASANAILKTLEEPGDATLIILVVDQLGKVMPTIRSRCQRIDFTLPDTKVATDWLASEAEIGADEAGKFLALAQGAPLLARDWKLSGVKELRAKFLSGLADLLKGRVSALTLAEQLQKEDVGLMLTWWGTLMSDIVQIQLAGAEGPKTNLDMAKLISAIAKRVDSGAIFKLSDQIHQERAALLYHQNPNKQLMLEKLFLDWKSFTQTD